MLPSRRFCPFQEFLLKGWYTYMYKLYEKQCVVAAVRHLFCCCRCTPVLCCCRLDDIRVVRIKRSSGGQDLPHQRRRSPPGVDDEPPDWRLRVRRGGQRLCLLVSGRRVFAGRRGAAGDVSADVTAARHDDATADHSDGDSHSRGNNHAG